MKPLVSIGIPCFNSARWLAQAIESALAQSWPESKITSKIVVQSLLAHWRRFGLAAYAKFDNDLVFQGAHHWPDSFGRVIRLCLQLGVTPVFAPPREQGFQAEIEAFNGRFRAECLNAHWFMTLADAQEKLEAWRRYYNEERPHGAIGNKAPIHLQNRGDILSPSP